MCLQCTTKAVAVLPDALPGFSLYQARVGAPDWPAGWYGLVECNDPTVVFPGPLLTDPTAGMTDEQLNALPDFPPGYQEFMDVVDALGERLVLPAMSGYHLATACKAQGYNEEEHGNLHYWLMQYLAGKVAPQPESSTS